ncbi:PREDICTED: dynein light chain, cytoplasmic [Erythranthe guttata]|nr:PREDICTED: dynein light chain, cytoplasmic [Erythranthe guttata]|eukprot:XP_012845966.1 PREDICTED: dynein light chain, cytoplasmic [Erythranthe guttata]
MEGAEEELERRSKFLSSLILQKKKNSNNNLYDKILLDSQEFDTTYGPAWHCIVGTSFGSYVTHSIGGFLYFSIDKVYVLLFKTAVEPLDQ